MLDDKFRELSGNHSDQRYSLTLITVLGFAVVAFLTFWLIGWVDPTSAQESSAVGTPAQNDANNSDLAGRVEELSRSQDRLVTALIAAVGAIGTVLILVVGLSTFQANRNAERESELIRGIAMNRITEAASLAKTQVDDIVETAKQNLASANAEAIANSERILSARLSDATRRMEVVSDGEIDRLRTTVDSIRKESGEFATAATDYFAWMGSTELEAVRDLTNVQEPKSQGLALVNLAMMGSEIARLREPLNRGLLASTSLALLTRGLELINMEFEVPEQNVLWFENRNQNLNLVNRLIERLKNDFGLLPGESRVYQTRIEGLEKFLPSRPDRPSPQQLERLVSAELAKKATKEDQ